MAYRAEIEIGVKGVKELDKFQSQLERLSNEVDRVNKRIYYRKLKFLQRSFKESK